MKTLHLLTVLIACSLVTGCVGDEALIQRDEARFDGALQTKSAADQADMDKAADLNKSAVYAISISQSAIAQNILFQQIKLLGKGKLSDAFIQKSVQDLVAKNPTLFVDVNKVVAAKQEADKKFNDLLPVLKKDADKVAKDGQQEQQDNSWGGLSGWLRYTQKSFWTIIWVVAGLAGFIVLLRLVSITDPAAGAAIAPLFAIGQITSKILLSIITWIFSHLVSWIFYVVPEAFQSLSVTLPANHTASIAAAPTTSPPVINPPPVTKSTP